MNGVGIIMSIILGGLAGFIAEKIMKANVGLLTNIILGIVGALFLNFILGLLGVYTAPSLIVQFIVAIVGVTDGQDKKAVSAMISFICIYIFFFATTWGPGAWVVVGEIYPLPIRARGVALSTASNWLWNCVRLFR